MPTDEAVFEQFDGLTEVPHDIALVLRSLSGRPQQLRSFRNPKSLTRAALAAASVTPVALEVIKAACEVVGDDPTDLKRYEPADLAALSWALAVADHQDVPTMEAIGSQLADRAWEFGTEDLAKTMVAFAELGLKHEAMLHTVSMEVMWKIDQFSARSLAQVAESTAKLEYTEETMFHWLAARVIGRLEDYSNEDLASVLFSFAKASIKNEDLFNTIASEIAKKWSELEEWELSKFMWAFDQLGIAHRGVTQPLYHPCLFRSGE